MFNSQKPVQISTLNIYPQKCPNISISNRHLVNVFNSIVFYVFPNCLLLSDVIRKPSRTYFLLRTSTIYKSPHFIISNLPHLQTRHIMYSLFIIHKIYRNRYFPILFVYKSFCVSRSLIVQKYPCIPFLFVSSSVTPFFHFILFPILSSSYCSKYRMIVKINIM